MARHNEVSSIPQPGNHIRNYTHIHHKPDGPLQQFNEWGTWESCKKKTTLCAKYRQKTSFLYDHIIPALLMLHWLPDKYRIGFKTMPIIFKGFHSKAASYIQEVIVPSKSRRHYLRSNKTSVPKVWNFKHDTFSKHALAVCGGPLARDSLQKATKLYNEIKALKQSLKIHHFIKFANECTL